MTRAAIVQRLLDEDKITAEEAVVLLSPAEESYTYNPTDLGYQSHRGTDSYWFLTSTIDDRA